VLCEYVPEYDSTPAQVDTLRQVQRDGA
jgi:hypothetical protein